MQTLIARYRVTTPLFMGAPAGTDQAELNLRGVKGAVRFWWRALNYARLTEDGKNLKALHEAEGRLFGAAAEKDRDWGASRIKWRVAWEGGTEPKVHATHLPGAEGRQGIAYLANQGLSQAGNNAGRLRRPCYWDPNSPMMLTVELRAPDAWVRNDEAAWAGLQDALRLFGLLGGIGSRKSRGFGSVTVEALHAGDAAIAGPEDVERYFASVAALLGAYTVESAKELPAFAAFWAESRVWLIATAGSTEIDMLTRPPTSLQVENDPLSLLDHIGLQMIRYRSFGSTARRGQTLLGEPAEQNFVPDHDWAKTPLAPAHASRHAARIAFGMPQGYTNCDVAFIKPRGQERRGSPLLIHIHRLGDGEHIAVATMLPAKLAPAGQLEISLRSDPRKPVARMLMPGFEERDAWDVLTRFVAGRSKASGKPYFDRQQPIWPAMP